MSECPTSNTPPRVCTHPPPKDVLSCWNAGGLGREKELSHECRPWSPKCRNCREHSVPHTDRELIVKLSHKKRTKPRHWNKAATVDGKGIRQPSCIMTVMRERMSSHAGTKLQKCSETRYEVDKHSRWTNHIMALTRSSRESGKTATDLKKLMLTKPANVRSTKCQNVRLQILLHVCTHPPPKDAFSCWYVAGLGREKELPHECRAWSPKCRN